ncbi:MAG: hypothetical protein KME15_07780 [Drouetiella hepatica Uher 2000/2452]|jgi:predicted component of type VI protein secretion system|uniref:Uncharacterized protein n=1 Tax=Drouetiella hepatica Uher 2000/2452 TaxID=904376 RepID=A0A951Q985_9CYAN|nr:hypothetical protein [Drouetiella hepatica Uher 2000/2452]
MTFLKKLTPHLEHCSLHAIEYETRLKEAEVNQAHQRFWTVILGIGKNGVGKENL